MNTLSATPAPGATGGKKSTTSNDNAIATSKKTSNDDPTSNTGSGTHISKVKTLFSGILGGGENNNTHGSNRRISATYRLGESMRSIIRGTTSADNDEHNKNIQNNLEEAVAKLNEELNLLASKSAGTGAEAEALMEALKRDANCEAEDSLLISDMDKRCFLRSIVGNNGNDACFDIKLALKRMVTNWEFRLKIFGKDFAYMPLTLDGALRNDILTLESDFVRVLEDVYDDSGRGILFVSPSKFINQQHNPLSMVRTIWYHVHVLLEYENVQKNGFIILVNPKNVSLNNISYELQKLAAYSGDKCFPTTIQAFHFCQPNYIFRVLELPFMKYFLGPILSARINVNGKDQMIEKLEKHYGIPPTCIPTDISGGQLALKDQKVWLQERRQSGK